MAETMTRTKGTAKKPGAASKNGQGGNGGTATAIALSAPQVRRRAPVP